MTHRQAIKNQLERAKAQLTEKGYRDFLKRFSSLSTEYFQNGGRFNIMDYEQKPQSNKYSDQEYEDGMRQAEEDLKEPHELENDDDED